MTRPSKPSSLGVKEDLLGERVPPEEARTFEEFRRAVGATRWDFLVLTDGSGSTGDKPGGYAAVIVDRRKAEPKLVAGACSDCTSQQAEARAVLEAANWLIGRKAGAKAGGAQVYLVSDSKYVVGVLERIVKDPLAVFTEKSHNAIWAGIVFAARVGIVIRPTHVLRNSNPLMTLADSVSKSSRLCLADDDRELYLRQTLVACQDTFPLSKPDTKPRRGGP